MKLLQAFKLMSEEYPEENIIDDPICDSGGSVIEFAKKLLSFGLTPSTVLRAFCSDTDITSLRLAYIQLSLFSIPAVFYLGDFPCYGKTIYMTPIYKKLIENRKTVQEQAEQH